MTDNVNDNTQLKQKLPTRIKLTEDY